MQRVRNLHRSKRVDVYTRIIRKAAEVELEVRGEGTVVADPTLLERAVSNLVSNAIRHTVRGGTLRISTADDGHVACIAVENPGSPIPADQLVRISIVTFAATRRAPKGAARQDWGSRSFGRS